MTKKELLEAIKDMPEDAEVYVRDYDRYSYEDFKLEIVKCDEHKNKITIC